MKVKQGKSRNILTKETIAGVLALLISVSLVVLAVIYRDFLTSIAYLGAYGLLGVFIMSFVAGSTISVTFMPVPYWLLVFILSDTLSPQWGVLAPVFVGATSAAGASLGELPTFMIGYGGKRLSERLASRINARYCQGISEWIKKHGSLTVFLTSAVINPLHLPITIAVGTLNFPPLKWFIFTLLGNLVKSLAIAFAGYFSFDLLFQLLGR